MHAVEEIAKDESRDWVDRIRATAEIEYKKLTRYSNGRLKYDPAIHSRHKTPFGLEEKIYLAKYYDFDGERMMSAALERPEYAISRMVGRMRKNGEWELYRNLTFEEYERIILTAERSEKNEEGLCEGPTVPASC